MGEAKTCPHPREPLSGTPTAQIGGREMIAYVSLTLPRCKFEAHFKDEGDNKRPLTPMSVQNVKTWQSSGELILPGGLQGSFPKVRTDSPEGSLQVFGGYLFWG